MCFSSIVKFAELAFRYRHLVIIMYLENIKQHIYFFCIFFKQCLKTKKIKSNFSTINNGFFMENIN